MYKTLSELNTEFNKLPKELQDFIMSDETQDSMLLIAEEYVIEDEQFDEFVLALFALLVGEGTIQDFIEKLIHSFDFSEEEAEKIVVEVSELILEPASFVLSTIKPEEELVAANGAPTIPEASTITGSYIYNLDNDGTHVPSDHLIPEHLSQLPVPSPSITISTQQPQLRPLQAQNPITQVIRQEPVSFQPQQSFASAAPVMPIVSSESEKKNVVANDTLETAHEDDTNKNTNLERLKYTTIDPYREPPTA